MAQTRLVLGTIDPFANALLLHDVWTRVGLRVDAAPYGTTTQGGGDRNPDDEHGRRQAEPRFRLRSLGGCHLVRRRGLAFGVCRDGPEALSRLLGGLGCGGQRPGPLVRRLEAKFARAARTRLDHLLRRAHAT